MNPTEKQIAYILSSVNQDPDLKVSGTNQHLEAKIRANMTSYQASSLIDDIMAENYTNALRTLNNL